VDTRTVSLRDGLFTSAYQVGGSGPPLVFLHGAGMPAGVNPTMAKLADHFTVYAPIHPGWGETPEEIDHIDDIIDFALYYQDFFDAVGIERPVVVGHSLGGMLAAEIAALCSPCISKLVLVAPVGLWRDDLPIPDIFTMGPQQLAPIVWHDLESPAAKAMLTPPETPEAQAQALLARAQSMAAAGKFLWPIPDKGLKKRIHRISVPTLILWGESDQLAPAGYAHEFNQKIKHSQLQLIPAASHMVLVEQPAACAEAILSFAK
jgi:pimeloyl-ACP methyl ester carboxylesterase